MTSTRPSSPVLHPSIGTAGSAARPRLARWPCSLVGRLPARRPGRDGRRQGQERGGQDRRHPGHPSREARHPDDGRPAGDDPGLRGDPDLFADRRLRAEVPVQHRRPGQGGRRADRDVDPRPGRAAFAGRGRGEAGRGADPGGRERPARRRGQGGDDDRAGSRRPRRASSGPRRATRDGSRNTSGSEQLVTQRVLDEQVRDETYRQFEEAIAARDQANAMVSEAKSARDQAAADRDRARVDVEAAKAAARRRPGERARGHA